MPGFTEIPSYMRWLPWATPASYAFEGVMINQFVDAEIPLGVTVPAGELGGTTLRMGLVHNG